jgi:hypothetical protein
MNGHRRIDGDKVFWGSLVFAAGVILLLNSLGILDPSWTLGRFWPLFIVTVGISKLLHRRSIWSGLWLIVLGAWLQAVTLHVRGFTYESSWPLLLVILCSGIILSTIVGSGRRRDEEDEEGHHV